MCLLVACTDPHARPVAPVVEASFAPSFKLTSPGRVQGSLYMFDSDGLWQLDLSVKSADSALLGDSAIGLLGQQELVRPISWNVPAGMAIGTSVRVVARVRDFPGFVTADTVFLTVQDTVPGGP